VNSPATRTASAIRVQGLTRDYGHGPVLEDLSFELAGGETLAVIGPSGCGKSSLLSILAGLSSPQAGSVTFPGGRRPRIALILQEYGLFPWKTVRENIALPLVLDGTRPGEREQAVAAMVSELQLDGLENRYPGELSGGQRQRVAIGRALITRPDILLMDEPFSSLDAITRGHLQQVLLALWQQRGMTCVLVTHSVEEAAFLGRHVMVLGGTPAKAVLRLDNPLFGDPRCREREGFFAVTRRMHEALASGDAPCAG